MEEADADKDTNRQPIKQARNQDKNESRSSSDESSIIVSTDTEWPKNINDSTKIRRYRATVYGRPYRRPLSSTLDDDTNDTDKPNTT